MGNTGIMRFPVKKSDLNAAFSGPVTVGDFQWWLIHVSRWANSNQYLAGWWDGEVDGDNYGIVCLGSDYVKVFPGDIHNQLDDSTLITAAQLAKQKSSDYLTGYWNGERLVYHDHSSIQYVCIKNQKAKIDQALVSDLKNYEPQLDDYGLDWFYKHSSGWNYNRAVFRAVRLWATLPGLGNTPAKYVAALPLFGVQDTSQGPALWVLGFK